MPGTSRLCLMYLYHDFLSKRFSFYVLFCVPNHFGSSQGINLGGKRRCWKVGDHPHLSSSETNCLPLLRIWDVRVGVLLYWHVCSSLIGILQINLLCIHQEAIYSLNISLRWWWFFLITTNTHKQNSLAIPLGSTAIFRNICLALTTLLLDI